MIDLTPNESQKELLQELVTARGPAGVEMVVEHRSVENGGFLIR